MFVDIRISRAVRAVGFKEAAFEKLIGDDRYRWMKSLGNKRIVTKSGPKIPITEPKAANDLLDLAIAAAKDKRRIIFFCSCAWPRCDGKVACHRTTVATLVLAAARRRDVPIEIVEWPGGKPGRISIDLQPPMFHKVLKGRMTIPLGCAISLRDWGGPPWGTICTLYCGNENIHRIIGPVIWQKDEWCLPVLYLFYDPDVGLSAYEKESVRSLRSHGLSPRESVAK
ncbi:MAG: hypothetical protein H6823_18220 [Planctomycetaceae bacterium]|nr:hypothetical protein [Planctomycetaceae bacterium]